jgi:hypothetical protein
MKKFQVLGFWFQKKKITGFTLLEILIGTFLVLLIFLGIFAIFHLGLQVIAQSKARLSAVSLATQEIELIRALDYLSVGVKNGFPEGNLEPLKIKSLNNIDFTIKTRVDYVADPADGLIPPDDECPNDYKKAQVLVSWQGILSGKVTLTTNISPQNLAQECTTTGGILKITVFDSKGILVSSPLIEIKDPETDLVLKTAVPDNGQHFFVLEEGSYKIVVSKTGYSSERTYSLKEIAIPEKPNPVILEGQLTELSFSIDKLASFSVATLEKDTSIPIPKASFHLQGTKIIGKDEQENLVYKYSQDHITDEQGQLLIKALEWDSYNFSVDPKTGLDLVRTDPSPQPIDLAPDTNLQVILYLEAENRLLVKVQEKETKTPIFSAEVRLFNNLIGYDKIQFTDKEGQTLFIPLESANYNIEITAPNYESFEESIFISGDVEKIYELERIE